MTKKDYERIAQVIYRGQNALPNEKLVPIPFEYLLDTLTQDNPRFDADRFTKACGLVDRV